MKRTFSRGGSGLRFCNEVFWEDRDGDHSQDGLDDDADECPGEGRRTLDDHRLGIVARAEDQEEKDEEPSNSSHCHYDTQQAAQHEPDSSPNQCDDFHDSSMVVLINIA